MPSTQCQRFAGLNPVPNRLRTGQIGILLNVEHVHLQQFFLRIAQAFAGAAVGIENPSVPVMHKKSVHRLLHQCMESFVASGQGRFRLLAFHGFLFHAPQLAS